MYLKRDDQVSLRYTVDTTPQAKGVVIINHGFAEHIGRYDHVAAFLVDHHYHVLRYDGRGHGKSLGPRGHMDSYQQQIDDCDAMVDVMKELFPNLPLFILGHSMGGLVSALYGIQHGDRLTGMVLTGPAVGYLPQTQGIQGNALKLAYKAMPRVSIPNPINDDVCSDPKVVLDYQTDPDVLRKVTLEFLNQFLLEAPKALISTMRDFSIPVLILHGSVDKIVPVGVSEVFYNTISSTDKKHHVYTGCYHEILNEPNQKDILADIVLWLNAHV